MLINRFKDKRKSMTLILRHKPHTSAVTELCVTHKAGVQPRPQSKLALADSGLQPYSYTSP